MGQIISGLYIYLKSICPPCIEYYTVDETCIVDISANVIPIIDISANVIPIIDISANIIDISANIIPIIDISANIIPIIDTSANVIPIIDISANVIPTKNETPANILNPIKKEKKQSLAEILRSRYKISIEKSKTLAQEFRTLKYILELTESQLAECKSKSGRKFGAHMGSHLYALLHA